VSYHLLRVAALRVVVCALCAGLGTAVLAQRGSQGYVPQVIRGREALADHKWLSASDHFRTALQWDSRGVDAHFGLGEAYLHTGQPQRAQEEFAAALRLRPHFSAAERGLHEARSPAEQERALQAIAEDVKNAPGSAEAHCSYAEALLDSRQIEAALAAAKRAIELDPKQGHAYCVLGRIAAKGGKEDEARTLLDKAVRLDGTDDDAISLLGDLAMRRKDYVGAARLYRRVVHMVPDDSVGHRKLAEALAAAGDTRGATRERQWLSRLSVTGE